MFNKCPLASIAECSFPDGEKMESESESEYPIGTKAVSCYRKRVNKRNAYLGNEKCHANVQNLNYNQV